MAADRDVRDLAAGVPLSAFDETPLVAGKVGDDEVVLVRGPAGYVALDARCSHAGAPLAKGTLVGGQLRCPWHHACFDVASGAATAAPALAGLGCWEVEQRDGRIHVGARIPARSAVETSEAATNESIVIIGAGAAGAAAAAALVDLGHGSRVTLIGEETEAPYDRTMLTKQFLSGNASADELPLTMPDLAAGGVTLRLGCEVAAIEAGACRVVLTDGGTLSFGKLILATGAAPRTLDVPGADLPHVRLLRTAQDARDILAALAEAHRIVIVGGSFIGLEAAASLRDRSLDVAVVARERQPFAKTLGPALSDAIVAVHRRHGTALHLGREVARIARDAGHLDDGTRLPADLVIVGVGVEPRTSLAEQAGLRVDNGVIVDERLRTSDRDIYAVGDIARWPDPHSGEFVRVEHWAVAQRQAQIAAANAVGCNLRYDVVPFFWTMHFDLSVRVVGHATQWDDITVEGDPGGKEAVLRFRRNDREVAVATVERDKDNLAAELAMERRLGRPAVSLPMLG